MHGGGDIFAKHGIISFVGSICQRRLPISK
jgi:hypothetical protein